MYHKIHVLGKETTDNPSNITAATKLFFSVYVIGMTCFDDNWETLSSKSLSLLWGLFQPPCCCVLWKNYFERGLYFTLPPQ